MHQDIADPFPLDPENTRRERFEVYMRGRNARLKGRPCKPPGWMSWRWRALFVRGWEEAGRACKT